MLMLVVIITINDLGWRKDEAMREKLFFAVVFFFFFGKTIV